MSELDWLMLRILMFNFSKNDLDKHFNEICEQLIYEISIDNIEWVVV